MEQLLAGLVKLRQRAKYEQLDSKLQELVSSFRFVPRDVFLSLIILSQ